MKKRDLTIVWIAVIGVVFWLVTVRPAPIRKPLRKARRVKVRAVVTNANADTGESTNATKLATVTTRGLR